MYFYRAKHTHLQHDVPVQWGCLLSSLDRNRDAVVWKPCQRGSTWLQDQYTNARGTNGDLL